MSMGDYATAEPLLVDCFEMTKIKFGDDHPESLTLQQNLGKRLLLVIMHKQLLRPQLLYIDDLYGKMRSPLPSGDF